MFYYRSYYVFFFKQKTAYEMRISDWSSDVCSSDLVNMHSRPWFGGPMRKPLAPSKFITQVDEPMMPILCSMEPQETPLLSPILPGKNFGKIGRASCRERVCQYV